MTSTSSVNYKDSYFKHPFLTAIRGEPTYETLHHLKNKLKANASSFPTTLVGGNHGYLGMILTPADYFRIAPTDPFTRPPNTGVLVPNPVGTAAQIASTENNHCLTKKLYLDTLLLERTFIQKIIEAIDTIYYGPLKLHHWKNFNTRPDHPLLSSQQLWTHHPPATRLQYHHCQSNDLQSGPTH